MIDPQNEPNQIRCSFCDKSKEEVRQMIGGPKKVFICNECVALCDDIVIEDSRDTAQPMGMFFEPELDCVSVQDFIERYLTGVDLSEARMADLFRTYQTAAAGIHHKKTPRRPVAAV